MSVLGLGLGLGFKDGWAYEDEGGGRKKEMSEVDVQMEGERARGSEWYEQTGKRTRATGLLRFHLEQKRMSWFVSQFYTPNCGFIFRFLDMRLNGTDDETWMI
jgi:hypothetical protein